MTEPLDLEHEVSIDSLTQDGRGVARLDGKVLFIDGALPGERVRVSIQRRQRRHDEAALRAVVTPSPDRVKPRCPHFGVCGGCLLQHLAPAAQIAAKRQVLEDALQHIGQVAPQTWLKPVTGPVWGYREKARLGAKWVVKKNRLLVGFRERRSSYLADLSRCETLHPAVGERLGTLREVIDGLSIRDQIPQVEVSRGDNGTILVFRHLLPLTAADRERLRVWGAAYGFSIYLQSGGPTSLLPLDEPLRLTYRLPAAGVTITFEPGDFTQVNRVVNQAMVDLALTYLDPQPGEGILDLFCGLGNFTLPIAARGATVLGVEGDAGLVVRAEGNARDNGLAARFLAADLQNVSGDEPWWRGGYHRALIDPPRSGALAVLEPLARTDIQRLVYFSCYPATLARDAQVLVHQWGFRFQAAGVLDMFPHTAHVESLAVFER
ncbi:MAG: 23S rRNA (uracil(1939)-C(5))-methyltransferase RlmD [Pseudomonadota bacterium]